MTCPACHYGHEADARFCAECGQPLETLCPACGGPSKQYRAGDCGHGGQHLGSMAVFLVPPPPSPNNGGNRSRGSGPWAGQGGGGHDGGRRRGRSRLWGLWVGGAGASPAARAGGGARSPHSPLGGRGACLVRRPPGSSTGEEEHKGPAFLGIKLTSSARRRPGSRSCSAG
jgi:hypothetical protein